MATSAAGAVAAPRWTWGTAAIVGLLLMLREIFADSADLLFHWVRKHVRTWRGRRRRGW